MGEFLAREAAPNKTGTSAGQQREAVSTKSQSGSFVPEPPVLQGSVAADTSSANAYSRALQAYYAYRVDAYRHRTSVFRWQLFASQVTFVVVIALVGTGIAFSAIQFRASLPRGPNTGQSPAPALDRLSVPETPLAAAPVDTKITLKSSDSPEANLAGVASPADTAPVAGASPGVVAPAASKSISHKENSELASTVVVDTRSADQQITEIQLSPTAGLRISSPVLGLLILGLSLGFFYLYLVSVYPIRDTF